MNHTAVIQLPAGYWLDGERHRDATLRALTGRDEEFLLESGPDLLPVHRTTLLLTRCLTRLGPLTPVNRDAVRSLTVGDREALLLHLRRLTLGDVVQAVVSCPEPDCGERLDLELRVSDLLLPAYDRETAVNEVSIQENGTTYRVRFRLPTGADQEATASLAADDGEAAATLMLHRCVEAVVVEGEEDRAIEDWPPALRRHLPGIMADLDPQADLVLNLHCPVCEQAFSVTFDTGAYLFQEILARSRHLYREVHLLAYYYHWSETEILGMTGVRRQRYLDLLGEALTEGERW